MWYLTAHTISVYCFLSPSSLSRRFGDRREYDGTIYQYASRHGGQGIGKHAPGNIDAPTHTYFNGDCGTQVVYGDPRHLHRAVQTRQSRAGPPDQRAPHPPREAVHRTIQRPLHHQFLQYTWCAKALRGIAPDLRGCGGRTRNILGPAHFARRTTTPKPYASFMHQDSKAMPN
jgi:hypothetical protein